MITADSIVTNYLNWIKDNTLIKNINNGEVFSISTPFIDRNNDCIDLYVIKTGDKYRITDNGYTVQNLKMSGFELNTKKRQSAFETIVNGFGIKIGKENELFTESDGLNIGEKKFYLIQSILSVNDLFVLSQENVQSFFKEDLELFLSSNKVIFTKDVKITGKAGINHNVDFIIPSISNSKEKLIKTLNTPSKDNINSAIFMLSDIINFRTQSEPYLIYNDTSEQEISDASVTALKNYSIHAIPFSQKDKILAEIYTSPYV